ncbi:porin family protein [Rudanella lutea]|uniref:porin family protein n=1 Tax=Rudanella lutea TaxID=451374 RepID=UPI00035EBA27|nr:porin family protein [Rudanella lutea]
MKTTRKSWLALGLMGLGAFLFQPTDATAQNRVRAGIKGGFNASSISFENANANDRKERYGFHGGVYAQIPAGEFFAIQPELLYSAKGASANYNLNAGGFNLQGRNTFRLNYAELPVLATFKLGNAVELQAGPYAAYLVNSNVSSTGDLGNSTLALNRDAFNKFDYGVAGGLNVFLGKALIGLRYGQGLQNIANSAAARTVLGNAKNGVGMISVGFSVN